jgi:hypothetical protein
MTDNGSIIDDLKSRLRKRWPEAELVDDWSQGAPLKWIKDVCRYWAEEYDWPQREGRLNRFAQFTTEIGSSLTHKATSGRHSPQPGTTTWAPGRKAANRRIDSSFQARSSGVAVT